MATRNSYKRLGILFLLLAGGTVSSYFAMIRMPGKSFTGTLPALTEAQAALAEELRRDVTVIAGDIGPRCIAFAEGLTRSVEFIERTLAEAGLTAERQTFEVEGHPVHNIIAEIKGATRPDEIVLVGAHYDSCHDTPAANDNGSGVAAALALARRFSPTAKDFVPPDRTIRFVFFVNEEPPYFKTEDMGSMVHARACRAKNENIVAMFSLETMGYYSDEPGSQRYPIKPIGWLYPDVGDFITFVGNFSSRDLVRRSIATFRENARFPSQGAALPAWIEGVAWSDQWAFWENGYPGVMLTDTAPYRYPHYHEPTDTPDKLDYSRFARVVEGVQAIVRREASISQEKREKAT